MKAEHLLIALGMAVATYYVITRGNEEGEEQPLKAEIVKVEVV